MLSTCGRKSWLPWAVCGLFSPLVSAWEGFGKVPVFDMTLNRGPVPFPPPSFTAHGGEQVPHLLSVFGHAAMQPADLAAG